MKVKLKDIRPNPFRMLGKYSINEEKVEELVGSIKHTGFWKNIVARRMKDGTCQIAFGHHRIEALRRVLKPDDEIDIIVEDHISDDRMLQMMCNENYAMYNMSPSVINEVVKAVIEHLKNTRRIDDEKNHPTMVAEFLGWPMSKVKEAIMSVSEIEKGVLAGEIETLPSLNHVSVVRSLVSKHKISKDVQKKVVEAVKKEGLGYRAVHAEVMKHVNFNVKANSRDFDDHVRNARSAVKMATAKLHALKAMRGWLTTAEGFQLMMAIARFGKVAKIINEIYKGEGGVEQHGRSDD